MKLVQEFAEKTSQWLCGHDIHKVRIIPDAEIRLLSKAGHILQMGVKLCVRSQCAKVFYDVARENENPGNSHHMMPWYEILDGHRSIFEKGLPVVSFEDD